MIISDKIYTQKKTTPQIGTSLFGPTEDLKPLNEDSVVVRWAQLGKMCLIVYTAESFDCRHLRHSKVVHKQGMICVCIRVNPIIGLRP